MSVWAFRCAAAALLTAGGLCVGEARCQRFAARRRALEETVGLLCRIREEIDYRRADLGGLYRSLSAEYPPDGPLGRAMRAADGFCRLAPPAALGRAEGACFAECMAGLGHSGARQECSRLDYYVRRFEDFLSQARQAEACSRSLDRRLGFAAGAMLGLLVL